MQLNPLMPVASDTDVLACVFNYPQAILHHISYS